MTRACIALARGDIGQAFHYNPFSFGLIFFAGAVALFPHPVRRCWQWFPDHTRTLFTGSILALVLGFWVYRILL